MRKFNILAVALLATSLSGCSVITGIFKAGAVTATIVIVLVIALVIWLASMFRK